MGGTYLVLHSIYAARNVSSIRNSHDFKTFSSGLIFPWSSSEIFQG